MEGNRLKAGASKMNLLRKKNLKNSRFLVSFSKKCTISGYCHQRKKHEIGNIKEGVPCFKNFDIYVNRKLILKVKRQNSVPVFTCLFFVNVEYGLQQMKNGFLFFDEKRKAE